MASESGFLNQPTQGRSWLGTDLRSLNLLRSPDSLATSLNLEMTNPGGSLTSRYGTRLACLDKDKGLTRFLSGLGIFRYVDSETPGDQGCRLLSCGERLGILTPGSFTITYSGSAVLVSADLDFDSASSSYIFRLWEDGILAHEFSVGVGRSYTDVTVTDLRDSIHALSDYSCSALTGDETPVAFISPFRGLPFESGQMTLAWRTLLEVPQCQSSSVFTGAWTNRDSRDFHGMSFASANGVVYFQSGFDEEYKYDGQRVYRSGLPTASGVSPALGAGTGVTGINIKYLVVFAHKDARGNIVRGIAAESTASVSPSNQSVDVTYNRITPDIGFPTTCIRVSGNQTGVTTITTGASNPFIIGDTVYLRDRSQPGVVFVEREVTGATGTSITITGPAVDVLNNDPISLNLRVELYRQTSATSNYFLVGSYPHDSTVATPVVTDVGQTLGPAWVDPLPGTEPGLPRKGRYIAIHRGIKFISGVIGLPNRVYFSDVTSPEAYAPDDESCSFDVTSNEDFPIRGIYGSQEFLGIFKEQSISILIGQVSQEGYFRYSVDPFSEVIGAVSHHSIKGVPSGKVYFLHETGIYSISGRSGIVEVSKKIAPLFRELKALPGYRPERAQAFIDKDRNQYNIHLPIVTTIGSDLITEIDSPVVSFQLSYQDELDLPPAYIWDSIDFSQGAAFGACGTLYFGSKSYADGAPKYTILARQTAQDPLCNIDHDRPITALGILGWVDGGLPSAFKAPLRTKVFSSDPSRSGVGAFSISVETDFRAGTVAGIDLDFSEVSGSGYSIDPYSNDLYGAPTEPEREWKLPRFKCKSMRYVISQSEIYSSLVLTGLETEFVPQYRQTMKE